MGYVCPSSKLLYYHSDRISWKLVLLSYFTADPPLEPVFEGKGIETAQKKVSGG